MIVKTISYKYALTRLRVGALLFFILNTFSIQGKELIYQDISGSDSLQTSIIYISEGTTIVDPEDMLKLRIAIDNKNTDVPKPKTPSIAKKHYRELTKNTSQHHSFREKALSENKIQFVSDYSFSKGNRLSIDAVSTGNSSFSKLTIFKSNHYGTRLLIDLKESTQKYKITVAVSNNQISPFFTRPPPEKHLLQT